jgi:hypothetical protein
MILVLIISSFSVGVNNLHMPVARNIINKKQKAITPTKM